LSFEVDAFVKIKLIQLSNVSFSLSCKKIKKRMVQLKFFSWFLKPIYPRFW